MAFGIFQQAASLENASASASINASSSFVSVKALKRPLQLGLPIGKLRLAVGKIRHHGAKRRSKRTSIGRRTTAARNGSPACKIVREFRIYHQNSFDSINGKKMRFHLPSTRTKQCADLSTGALHFTRYSL